MTYKPPAFNSSSFNCPHCAAFSHMTWHPLLYQHGSWHGTNALAAICTHCRASSYWLMSKGTGIVSNTGKMIYPNVLTAPIAHPDMPAEISTDYDEARNVAVNSPRAAAALLRLCVQKLCKHLGEPGKNINDDIGSLVKKGLPPEIQQALDVVRVIGNNAVHPGAITSDDIASVSSTLFELVNYIVEDRIARPKKLAAMFTSLPNAALAGIEARDTDK